MSAIQPSRAITGQTVGMESIEQKVGPYTVTYKLYKDGDVYRFSSLQFRKNRATLMSNDMFIMLSGANSSSRGPVYRPSSDVTFSSIEEAKEIIL